MDIVIIFDIVLIMIAPGDDDWAILGLTFFSAYHITIDRNLGTMKFELGCGCEEALDGYPKIIAGGNTVSPKRANHATKSRNISFILLFGNLILAISLI
jgi:hypothetical protein